MCVGGSCPPNPSLVPTSELKLIPETPAQGPVSQSCHVHHSHQTTVCQTLTGIFKDQVPPSSENILVIDYQEVREFRQN